jgi:hypothetical protein
VFDNDTFADSLEESPENALPFLTYNFAPGAYDHSQGLFEFDLTYNFPPLIVDCGNLYCGFVPGTIHWSFTDVADVKFASSTLFNKVDGNPEDGWQFIQNDGSDDNVVASIVFTRTSKKAAHKDRAFKGKA